MTALPDRYMAWARYREFSTGARHLPLSVGEVAEYPRPPRWLARIAGIVALVGLIAVGLAVDR